MCFERTQWPPLVGCDKFNRLKDEEGEGVKEIVPRDELAIARVEIVHARQSCASSLRIQTLTEKFDDEESGVFGAAPRCDRRGQLVGNIEYL
jgi:hypothetical protein